MKKIVFNEAEDIDFIRFLLIPGLVVSSSKVKSRGKEYTVEKVLIPGRYYDILKYYAEISTIILKNGVEYRLGMVKLGIMNKNIYFFIPKSLHREIVAGDKINVVFDLGNAIFRENVEFV